MEGLAADHDWPFVARAEELALLARVIGEGSELAGGPAGAVVVAEAGVGKTRLVREALTWAAEHGHHTAWVIATRSAAATPFAAFAHLLPDLPVGAHDDASSLHRTLAVGLVERWSGRRVVLGVDDAHLLDDGSAALVLRLVMTGSATVLVTARRGDATPDPVTALWKEGLCRRIDLQRLSLGETSGLIRLALGGDVAMREVGRLAEASEGNVLFARELVRAALEAGSLQRIDGVWRWDGRLPLTPRLIDTVGQRLVGLSRAERDALGLVAVADPLPVSVAERLAGPSCLSSLEAAGLLRVEGDHGAVGFRLGHPLYGEVLLSQLGAAECRRLMRTLADALDAREGVSVDDAMRIASWRLDGGGEVSAPALVVAARTAIRAFDYPLAERLARGARERGAGPSAAVALADAVNGQNRFGEAETLLAEAEPAVLGADDDQLRRQYLDARFTALFHGLSRPEDAEAMLDRVAGAGDDRGIRHLVAGYRAHVLVDAGRLRETLEVADSVLAEPAAADTSVLLAAATKAEALIELGRTRSAREVHTRLHALAARGIPGSGRARTLATLQELQCLFFDGRADDVIARLEAYDAALAHSRDRAQRGIVTMSLGLAYLLRGTPVSARHSLHDAVAALDASEFGGTRAWALALLAQAEALTGSVRAARRARQASSAIVLAGRSSRYEADFVTADALIAAADGNLTGAAELALAGAGRLDEQLVRRARVLHLALRLGAPVRTVEGPLAAIAADTEADLPRLFHEHALAVARDDGAGLESIAERFEMLGLWLFAAEAAAQASAVHRRMAVPSAAIRAAARSAVLAARCEGAHTPTLALSSPLAPLSRREREVAALAASGLSNAAIADRLTVSVRTVESHLYQAFGKLGVERREDLDAVLAPVQPASADRRSQ